MSSDSQSSTLNITMSGAHEGTGGTDEIVPFNQLSSDKFPLICTFNSFLRMVDKSLSSPFFSIPDTWSKEASPKRTAIDLFRFEIFYYPRLGDTTGGNQFKVYMHGCLYE
jgi:hypothetical protein